MSLCDRWGRVIASLALSVVVAGVLSVTAGFAVVPGNGGIAFLAGSESQLALTSGRGIVRPAPQPPVLFGYSWSADGRSLALLGGHGDIYRFEIATGRFKVVASVPSGPNGGYESVAWSRRGELAATRSIDFGARFRLVVMRADGTARRAIGPLGASRPAWSQDARWLAFVRNTSEIWRMRSDGSELRRVRGRAGSGDPPSRLAWSPDGLSIAFTTINQPGIVRLVDLHSTTRRIAGFTHFVSALGWAAAGRGLVIAVAGASTRPTVWRASDHRLERLASLPDGALLPAFSQGAARVAFMRDGGIELARADGSGARLLTTTGADGAPSFSPDGNLVSFTRSGRLAVIKSDGSGLWLVPVTGTPQVFSSTPPSWSPDGTAIAISLGVPATKYDPGKSGIALVHPERGSLDLVVPADPSPLASYDPEWSPDGSQIAFLKSKWVFESAQQPLGIWLVPPGGQPRQLLFGPVLSFSWSPDGSRIAAVTASSVKLVTVATGASADLPLPADWIPTRAVWSPDGTQLALTITNAADTQLSIVNADGTGARVLAPNATLEAWSPDGKRLLITSPGSTSGSRTISSIALDGSDRQILSTIGAADAHPAWQPRP